MHGKLKLTALFAFLLLMAASCSTWEDEPAIQDAEGKLINKKWYLSGKNGTVWVYYQDDGKWESSSGDYGSWVLQNSKTLKIQANQDLLENWEEDILDISNTYLETRVKGTSFSKKYQTVP